MQRAGEAASFDGADLRARYSSPEAIHAGDNGLMLRLMTPLSAAPGDGRAPSVLATSS